MSGLLIATAEPWIFDIVTSIPELKRIDCSVESFTDLNYSALQPGTLTERHYRTTQYPGYCSLEAEIKSACASRELPVQESRSCTGPKWRVTHPPFHAELLPFTS
ncbi:hypothetical protein CANCADRAFT_3823 [Tortispora caseinolytica NRRL Y-17796]|uniref:Uncharacterized protein n=1 Tax=Tortispora caseinolytica NRRL Y-17796 TaxID=767744 RepID=A0A1E4TBV1_9ASCO|nr:hypothetical protein CANCADRAFT_3823 [Tortispora caseinolytica NRRL Y-17796]